MSASAALQGILISALRGSSAVAAFVGSRVWDNARRKSDPEYPYITLGPSQELDDGAECIDGAECFQQIDVWTDEDGSQITAKRICGAVKKALHGVDLPIPDPFSLVLIEVESSRVVGDPDEKIAHGIVNVRALVEG